MIISQIEGIEISLIEIKTKTFIFPHEPFSLPPAPSCAGGWTVSPPGGQGTSFCFSLGPQDLGPCLAQIRAQNFFKILLIFFFSERITKQSTKYGLEFLLGLHFAQLHNLPFWVFTLGFAHLRAEFYFFYFFLVLWHQLAPTLETRDTLAETFVVKRMVNCSYYHKLNYIALLCLSIGCCG